MMPGNIFRLQLMADFADRRRIILRIAISALLSLPFILVKMPAHAQATGVVMVILFTGFFGAAVANARLRANLRLSRLKLLPISPIQLWLDLILSSVLVRLIPLMVVLGAFTIVNGRGLTLASCIGILGFLSASLVILTVIAIGVGRIARSNGEVHLFGALICVVLAFVSGVAPLPERIDFLTITMGFNPISRLLKALTAMASGSYSITKIEFVLAIFIVGLVSVLTVYRWISGRKS